MNNSGVDKTRRQFLTNALTVVGAVGTGFVAVPFLSQMQPSVKAKATGAPVEVNLSRLEPGQLIRVEWRGKPVWIGQISRDIGVHWAWPTITTHKIDPNVDETREFLVEDLAYTQGLGKLGYVGGVGSASYDEPRGNLTGDPYFTDGRRVVMWITGEPTSIREIEILDLEGF